MVAYLFLMSQWFWLGLLGGLALYLTLVALVRKPSPPKCEIDDDWLGNFTNNGRPVGHSYCHVHNVAWDDDGGCPRKGWPPGGYFEVVIQRWG